MSESESIVHGQKAVDLVLNASEMIAVLAAVRVLVHVGPPDDPQRSALVSAERKLTAATHA